jgi:hydroxyethylthiazole kinase-like sugar kinase family protein
VGERLLVMSRDEKILTKKLGSFSIGEIAEMIGEGAKAKGVDIDKLIDEAIEWARKSR